MALHDLLADQAPFTWHAARARGVRRPDLTAAVAAGDVQRLCPGLYLPTEGGDDPHARLAAHRLLLAPGAAFSHDTAAAALTGLDLPERLTVTVPPPARGPGRPCLRTVRARLPRGDVMLLGSVPLTSEVRTVLDVGAAVPDLDAALVLVDAVLHRRPGLLAEVLGAAGGQAGSRGVRRVRRALAAAEPLTESPQETRLRLALVAGGFPRPVAQHVVRAEGGAFLARLDLAYPELRVGIEYDGRASHPVGLAWDRDRSWALQQTGWLVVHVTAELLRRRTELWRRVGQAREAQAARSG